MRSVGWLVGIACVFVFPSAARAPYLGLLDRAPFTAAVIAGNNNVGETALTVTVHSGLRSTQQVYTTRAESGSEAILDIPIGSNAKRVVIEVAPPKNGSAILRVGQSGNLFEEGAVGDASFVYDIRP
jgi:hypothetical protein